MDDAFQAVFLILIRKAATLRDKNSLSSWLYGVSLRVAPARSNTMRRHNRERQDAEGLAMARTPEHVPADRETLLILDEEIRRLPEKQQAAVVLCLVQGKTHEVAAAELSCPLGTVKSRLAGGRATLARRLSRRGWLRSSPSQRRSKPNGSWPAQSRTISPGKRSKRRCDSRSADPPAAPRSRRPCKASSTEF